MSIPRNHGNTLSTPQADMMLRNVGLCKHIARAVWYALPRNTVPLKDLIQAGYLGLANGCMLFDHTFEVSEGCYLRYRVKGAILDSLRTADHLSRDDRKLATTCERIQHAVVSGVNLETACAKEGLTVEKFHRGLTLQSTNLSTDDTLNAPLTNDNDTRKFNRENHIDETAESPEKLAIKAEQHEQLSKSLALLTPRYQQVFHLYYWQGLTMYQIGLALNPPINESRVSQIHRRGLRKLADEFRKEETAA